MYTQAQTLLVLFDTESGYGEQNKDGLSELVQDFWNWFSSLIRIQRKS